MHAPFCERRLIRLFALTRQIIGVLIRRQHCRRNDDAMDRTDGIVIGTAKFSLAVSTVKVPSFK